MKKFFRYLVLVSLFLLLIPGKRADAAGRGGIANGVFVGPVDVSGMNVADAETAVKAYVDELSTRTITLSAGADKQMQISAGDAGIYWSNTGVVKEAYGLGHRGNVIERYKALKDLEHNNHVYDLEYGYDAEAVKAIVAQCAAQFDQEKVNSTLTKTDSGFVVKEGQTGYVVDQEASAAKIEEFIQHGFGSEGDTVELAFVADVPKGSAEDLAKIKDVLGTFTTSFKSSGSSRSANVTNGCRLINGTMLYPGEEFSVLDTITPFTEANGYYPAGSYLNGLVVESIGGGICQVSTTLYNAVLRAELQVTERHCHSMIIGYVKPSADAAIAESGGKNFRFVNNTEYPIYIDGYTTADKNITFTIYGVETRDPSRKVSFESEVIEETPASADQFVTDGSHKIGYVGTQSAHIGYKAQLWKIVTENGETKKEVINSSNYKMVPRIVTVGTGGADENSLAQLNTAIATGDLGTVKSVAGALSAAIGAAGTENAEAAAQAANDAVNAANAQLQQQADAAAAAAAPEAQPAAQTEAQPAAQTEAQPAAQPEAQPAAQPAATEAAPATDTAEIIQTN